jgi:hypothetical protein
MMDMDIIINEVAQKLVNCYEGKTTLRFPKYRNKRDRISEQESKFFFSIAFAQQKSPFSFAVEVPTEQTYIFKGKTPRSALHDMAIFDEIDTLKFKWIIELKSGQPKRVNIKKDFEKMVGAKCNCIWFHTLENSNSGTIPSLLDKFYDAWDNEKTKFTKEYDWHFAVVVLKTKKLYKTTLKTKNKISFLKDISKWKEILFKQKGPPPSMVGAT